MSNDFREATPRGCSVVACERQEITAGDVLQRAADLLEEFGWCRGQDYVKHGDTVVAFCAESALDRATRDLGGDSRVLNTANDSLTALLGQRGFEFNDASGRKKAQVVAALRKAATVSDRRLPTIQEGSPL